MYASSTCITRSCRGTGQFFQQCYRLPENGASIKMAPVLISTAGAEISGGMSHIPQAAYQIFGFDVHAYSSIGRSGAGIQWVINDNRCPSKHCAEAE